MEEFEKRIGFISNVVIKDGTTVAAVEDKNIPNKIHEPCIVAQDSFSKASIPPIGSKVLIERVAGEKIITQFLSSAGLSGMEEQKANEGAQNQAASMSFVFTRDEGETEEFVNIEYGSEGYNVNVDVKGNVSVSAEGNLEANIEGDIIATCSGKASVESGGKLNANAGGDIILEAGGDVKVVRNGTEEKVATVEHKHDVTYDGGGDNSSIKSTTTKTVTNS